MSIKLNLNRCLSTVLLLFIVSSISLAQISQPERFEIPSGDGTYEVISAGDNGLFLLIKTVELQTKEQIWQVIKLDTAFNVQWQRVYSVPVSQTLVSNYSDKGKLYFLFSRNQPKDRNMELISFNQEDGSALSYIIRNFIPLDFFDFKVIGQSAVIAGYYNFRPLVFLYNLSEGIPVVLPGLFGDRSELIQLTANSNNTFDILVSGRDINRQASLFLNTYDYSGALVKSLNLEGEEKRGLLFGKSTDLKNDEKLIAGVYGRFNSEYTRGLFLSKIDKNDQQSLSYYNYADLKNFFNYMRAKREKRVRDRIERRRINQKRIRFNYRILVHELIEDGDQFVLMGEAFYPKYKTVGDSYTGSGRIIGSINNGIIRNNRIFEGYRYTHAVVIGFDKSGKLLWDNSFEINDVLSMELKQYVHASIKDDKLALLYVYDDKIRSKIIREDEVLEGKELTSIELRLDSDRAIENKTNVMGLESWYNEVFYVYGTQEIKNLRGEGVDLRREVFFINKVIYK